MAALRALVRHGGSIVEQPGVRSFRLGTSKVNENVGTQPQANSAARQQQAAPEKLVLYQARWMRTLRVLVRLKIFQLGGFAALSLPFINFLNDDPMSPEAIVASIGVAAGATGASLALWYYSRRYVGELSLVPPYPHYVQISTVDFWGSRENLKFDLRRIDPPLLDATPTDLTRMASDIFIPLPVQGSRQFCLALKYARLQHKRLLFALLSGTLDASNFEELLDKKTTTTSSSPPPSS